MEATEVAMSSGIATRMAASCFPRSWEFFVCAKEKPSHGTK